MTSRPVYLVDPDSALRGALGRRLVRAGYGLVEAADGEEVLAQVGVDPPGLVLLEVVLPGMSGFEVLRLLRDRLPELPVFFLSGTRTEPIDRTAGLLLGADDYIVKPFDPDEVLARVRRRLAAHPEDAPAEHGLTARELEVLDLLTHGLPQEAIAEQLVISPRTVRTHIEHILLKLSVHSRAQAVARALREGIVEGHMLEPHPLH